MERYRITEEASVYFITYSVVEWLPVFIDDRSCKIITDSLNFCHDKKHLRTNAFVILPTHIHAIVFDAESDSARLQDTLTGFRKFTGRGLADHCIRHLPKSFSQEFKATSRSDRNRQFWQPSRHPVALPDEQIWEQKLNYIHANPVRKGLVRCESHWRFSSACYFENGKDESADIKITQIDWH